MRVGIPQLSLPRRVFRDLREMGRRERREENLRWAERSYTVKTDPNGDSYDTEDPNEINEDSGWSEDAFSRELERRR